VVPAQNPGMGTAKMKIDEKLNTHKHKKRDIIAIVAMENGAFCTVFSENFHKF
jgi:hypothetical protein